MPNDKSLYERMTPSEFVAKATEKVPETQRDEAKQLQQSQESLENQQWEPLKERYDIARWLARGLFWTFSFLIVGSVIIMLVWLILSAINPNIGSEEINLATDFVKGLLPAISTPLGIALGFYFRETRSQTS
jgi:hypothetical protein